MTGNNKEAPRPNPQHEIGANIDKVVSDMSGATVKAFENPDGSRTVVHFRIKGPSVVHRFNPQGLLVDRRWTLNTSQFEGEQDN